MSLEKRFGLVSRMMLAAMIGPGLWGCSQSGPGSTAQTGGASGGTQSSGGTIGSGGSSTSSSGGTTAGSGGTTSSGGSVSSGGAGSGGVTSSGGMTGSGGAAPSGGATGSGGAGRGGATGNGGATSSGGVTAAGGATSPGGATGSGGAAPAGGATGSGGASQRGGATGAGGGAAGGTVGAGGATGTGGTTDACPTLPSAPASNVITFTSSGGWCWYQDERAVVDTKANKLVIGSVVGSGSGVGNIQATIYDLTAKTGTTAKLGNLSVDDHDAPAINITPDGKYVAVWATHRSDCNTYYSTYSGTSWAAQKTFDWKSQGCPWDGDNTHMITYSNVWYMDGNLYDIARSVGTSPNLLQSTDDGGTWAYFGRLTYTPLTGYVAGYYKYWGNNTDRIDFLGTEAHPRDNNNSLWHGYMQGGKIYNSAGTVVDDALAGTSATSSAKNIDQYTQVFKTGTSPAGGPALCRMWNHDIVRYADGTIAILGQGRADNCSSTPSGSDPDKRLIYSRWDGQSWKTTYLVKAGPKLYSSEEDYTGLGALDPDNPHIIYISTTYDPRDDTTKSSKHEIWQGVTCDKGATWNWAPITKGSTDDQFRPIVPKWDGSHTALLWMKGTYTSAQNFATSVVGTITGP
jgi:hypothetical protein